MADNTYQQDKENLSLWKRMQTKVFWQQQNNWLGFLTFLLLFTLFIYLTTHTLETQTETKKEYWDDPHEAEFKKLDPADISYLTSLINQGSTFIKPEDIAAAQQNNIGDSTEPTGAIAVNIRFKDNPNFRVVKEYIVQQLPYVYPQDTIKFFALLANQPNSLAVNFIQEAKLRVKSYFWLAGPHTYFEIIFWTIFGVITSILFYCAVAISNGTGFRPEEIPGHMAKIAYSPFISLIIIFAYNTISGADSVVDVSASKGTLIIAFLLGFYSSRAMKLLDKLKDVFLPYGDHTTADESKLKKDEENANAAQNTTVTAELMVNDPLHPDTEDLNAHIAQAIVTLTPQAGGNPITLQKSGEDELDGTFSATAVAPGAYTLSAILATSDGGNYNGAQDVQVVQGENTFNLTLVKTEENG